MNSNTFGLDLDKKLSKKTTPFWFERRHRNMFSLHSLKDFWGPTSSLIAYQMSIGLPFVICGIMIGILGDSFSLGVFGLACTFVNMFFNSILNGITENLGVHCSQLFGSKDYNSMGSYFWKGFVSVMVLIVLFVVASFYSYEILTAIDVQDNVSYATMAMLKASIPYLIIQAINNLFVSYIASQSITKPLIYINSVSIFIVFIFAKYFIIDLNYKEIGFAYTKLIQEGANLICYLFVLLMMTDKKALFLPSFSLIFTDYWNYLKRLFMTVLSFYGEFIGFEINTYFAALLHDISELALWCTLVNFTGIVFFISIGFSNAFRTFLGAYIGEKKFIKARTLSQQYLVYLGIFSFALIIPLLIFKYEIGFVYTGDELLSYRMADILVIYCINVFPTLAFYSVASIYRLLGYDNLLFNLATIVYPIMVVSSSFVLCFPFHMKVYGINLGFALSKVAVIWYMIYKLYNGLEWQPKNDENPFVEKLVE
jgi:Na+-driven multidrug efflux pump